MYRIYSYMHRLYLYNYIILKPCAHLYSGCEDLLHTSTAEHRMATQHHQPVRSLLSASAFNLDIVNDESCSTINIVTSSISLPHHIKIYTIALQMISSDSDKASYELFSVPSCIQETSSFFLLKELWTKIIYYTPEHRTFSDLVYKIGLFNNKIEMNIMRTFEYTFWIP